jgi:hypothetical protein
MLTEEPGEALVERVVNVRDIKSVQREQFVPV